MDALTAIPWSGLDRHDRLGGPMTEPTIAELVRRLDEIATQ